MYQLHISSAYENALARTHANTHTHTHNVTLF